MLLKEEVALIAMGFGLYAAFFLGRRRYGVALVTLSALWGLLLVLVIMPALAGGVGYTFFSRYTTLGNTLAEMLRTLLLRPATIYHLVSTPQKLLYTLQLLFPLAFLPLVGFPAILLALPTYAYSMLSDYAFQTSITYQYTAPLIPFLMLATVVGLQRIRRRQIRAFHWASIVLAATTLISARSVESTARWPGLRCGHVSRDRSTSGSAICAGNYPAGCIRGLRWRLRAHGSPTVFAWVEWLCLRDSRWGRAELPNTWRLRNRVWMQ